MCSVQKGPLVPRPPLGAPGCTRCQDVPLSAGSRLTEGPAPPVAGALAHCPGGNKDCGFKLSDQAAPPSRKDRPPRSWAQPGGRRGTREKGDREPLKVTN